MGCQICRNTSIPEGFFDLVFTLELEVLVVEDPEIKFLSLEWLLRDFHLKMLETSEQKVSTEIQVCDPGIIHGYSQST